MMRFYAFLLLCCLPTLAQASQPVRAWVSSGNDGLFLMTLEPERARVEMEPLMEGAGADTVALHPKLPLIYVATRNWPDHRVAVFEIGEEGALEKRSESEVLEFGGPHLCVNPAGTLLGASYYNQNAVTVHRLNDDGSIGAEVFRALQEGSSVDPGRQKKSYPHWAGFSADGRFLLIVDLGTDEIWTYSVDGEDIQLQSKTKVPAGSGPRHMVFHESLPFAYVTEELSSQVSLFSWDAKSGELVPLEHYDMMSKAEADGYHNTSTLRIHPNGRFLYVGNRGNDLICVFAIDQADGRLSLVEREPARGSWPRHFDLSPDGEWMFVGCRISGSVAAFKVDAHSGKLSHVRQAVGRVSSPVFIQIVPN